MGRGVDALGCLRLMIRLFLYGSGYAQTEVSHVYIEEFVRGLLASGFLVSLSGLCLEGGNAFFEWGVGGEGLEESAPDFSGNSERGYGGGKSLGGFWVLKGPEFSKGLDHVLLGSLKAGGPGVGSEFSLAREPGHNEAGEDSKEDFAGNNGEKVPYPPASFVAEDEFVDEEA